MLVLSWLDCHAAAIQAVCALAGLGGLFWYCYLTLGIHRASVRQANAAVRPFIVIDELNSRDVLNYELTLLPISKKKIYIVRNLGTGPALDIQWVLGSSGVNLNNANWAKLGDLAAGDWSHIPIGPASIMCDRPQGGMTFRFNDIAENRYETIEECKDGIFYQKCRSIK